MNEEHFSWQAHFTLLAHIQQEICPSLGKSNQDYTERLHCNPGAQTEVVHVP